MNDRTILLYLLTWLLVALVPGPAVMCSMTLAARHGMRAALAGIAGIQIGHLVFFGCVASGLAALLAGAATTFSVLRVGGALYLVYLGVGALLASGRARVGETVRLPAPDRSGLLLQGLLVQITNPKALLFMSALLPQFIHADGPLGPQLCLLLAITIAVDVVVLTGYASLAARGVRGLRAPAAMAWVQRAFGATLIFFGIKLVAAARD